MPKPSRKSTRSKFKDQKRRGRPDLPYTMIQAGLVLTGEAEIRKGAVLFHGRRIVAVGRKSEVEAAARKLHDRSGRFALDVVEAPELVAVPGFIDIHQHGGGDADYMDGTADAVRTILKTHLRSGTTAVVPTLMTASRKSLRKAMAAIDEVRPQRKRGSSPAANRPCRKSWGFTSKARSSRKKNGAPNRPSPSGRSIRTKSWNT
jgi:hypothetical protein